MSEKKKDDAIVAEDLQKSLDMLNDYASQGDQKTRKEELLAKANEGELEKSEADELYQILGGNPAAEYEPSVGDELIKSMIDEANEGLQEALDVSPYLREQHEALTKSLHEIGEHIEKSDRRSHEMNMLQSRAIVEIGTLVKSMSERLGIIENQPVRGPKSRGVTPDQTLAKSFDGGQEGGDGGPGGEQLTKSEIEEAMDVMMRESVDGGMNGLSKSGEDIGVQITNFEMSSKISPRMLGDVKEFIRQRKAAH